MVHWVDGGRTDLANLVAVCPFHHDAHHRGEFSITRGCQRAGRVGVPGPGRVPDRAGPDLRPRGTPEPAGGGRGQGAASGPGRRGRLCTIGVSTERPGRPGPRLRRLGRSGGPAATPTRTPTPSWTVRPGCGPESDRRWRTRARPGRSCTASGSPSTKAHPCRCDAGGRHSRLASGRWTSARPTLWHAPGSRARLGVGGVRIRARWCVVPVAGPGSASGLALLRAKDLGGAHPSLGRLVQDPSFAEGDGGVLNQAVRGSPDEDGAGLVVVPTGSSVPASQPATADRSADRRGSRCHAPRPTGLRHQSGRPRRKPARHRPGTAEPRD